MPTRQSSCHTLVNAIRLSMSTLVSIVLIAIVRYLKMATSMGQINPVKLRVNSRSVSLIQTGSINPDKLRKKRLQMYNYESASYGINQPNIKDEDHDQVPTPFSPKSPVQLEDIRITAL
ncbi:hypothetical protein LR48_Vigan07g177800 [Vigna angularis]|uniref:Uncharacterized protein n=1 Tax=Phaseolus angularis TaxID=3914 RepID=A0A0L9UZW7_PHAAN|nr:hypothetical protein LR48_Vigan07g177800 [Vigna angularis]